MIQRLRALDASPRPARVIDGALDAIVGLLGAWTVAWQVGAVAGWSLEGIGVLFVLISVPLLWLLFRRPVPLSGFAPIDDGAVSSFSGLLGGVAPRWIVAAGGVTLLAILAVAATRGISFWVLAASAMAIAWWAARGSVGSRHPESREPSTGWMLVVAGGLVLAILSATTPEWAGDNTYYFDRAAAFSEWEGPVPVGVDTMHAEGEFPSSVAENDVSSFEPAAGALARMTGVDAISILSFVLHPLSALLSVLVLWRLCREIGLAHPDVAALVGGFMVLLLSNAGAVARIVLSPRMGKVWMVGVLVPLAIFYSIRVAAERGWVWPTLLAANVIAAVSMTLSAYVVIPGAVLVGLIVGWAGLGRLRSWVPTVIAAVVVAIDWVFLVLWATSFDRVLLKDVTRPAGSARVWKWALAFDPVHVVLTAVILLGWVVAPRGRPRRIMIALPAVLLVTISPPVLAVLEKTPAVTSIERMMWMLPIGLVFGVTAVALLRLRPRIKGVAVLVAILSVTVLLIPKRPFLEVGMPVWDVPRQEAAAAKRLVELAPEGARVAGPWLIVGLVPVVSSDVYPVAARHGSIGLIGAQDPDFGHGVRFDVIRYSQAGFKIDAEELRGWLDTTDVHAICFGPEAQTQRFRPTMASIGWESAGSDEVCEYWFRGP